MGTRTFFFFFPDRKSPIPDGHWDLSPSVPKWDRGKFKVGDTTAEQKAHVMWRKERGGPTGQSTSLLRFGGALTLELARPSVRAAKRGCPQ